MAYESVRGDYFDRARRLAAAALVIAGIAAIVGSALDWVTITAAEQIPGATEVRRASEPFTGFEARDGWYVAAAGVVIIACAILLVVRRARAYAWFALIASIIIGGIAIADMRGIDDISSSIARRMDIVGDADPVIGIFVVAASALIGVVAAAVSLAATPAQPPAR